MTNFLLTLAFPALSDVVVSGIHSFVAVVLSYCYITVRSHAT